MINTREVNLSDLDEYFFRIPIYQRRYVWGEVQINKLLSDIYGAYQINKDNVYYIGGVLVTDRSLEQNHSHVELVDGQQRFTTLWLISLRLNSFYEQSKLSNFRFKTVEGNHNHRIDFVNRDPVKEFFSDIIAGKQVKHTTDNYLSMLPKAIEHIDAFFNTLKTKDEHIDFVAFSDFIANQVKLVMTNVPSSFNLNKLFEVVNNRGLQLQHHEILKSRLLACLDYKDREAYNLLWVCCSNMGNYIERNLRVALKSIKDKDQESATQQVYKLFAGGDLGNAKSVITSLNKNLGSNCSDRHDKGIGLADILQDIPDDSNRTSSTYVEVNFDDDDESSESILNFSQLLQHTLRIFLFEKRNDDSNQYLEDIDRVHDSSLLEIFDVAWLNTNSVPSEDVKKFIELLWQVRYQMDIHVIRWYSEADQLKYLNLFQLTVREDSNGYKWLAREERSNNNGSVVLQSMLYHSQEKRTQYWLTPFLYPLLTNSKIKNSYVYLQHLEQYLLCSKESESETLRVRSYKFLSDPWRKPQVVDIKVLIETDASKGTGSPHYWFYKLEYVLWHQMFEQKKDHWQSFRMTARNSVEHISPQTQRAEDKYTVSSDVLDTFGNLALVTGSVNSEYGNDSYEVKRTKFNQKLKVDSLKMDLIYENTEWSDHLATKHQDAMINKFIKYFNYVGTITSMQEEANNE